MIVEVKTLLEGNAKLSAEPGWRSGYRASLEIKQKRAKARNGKIAGGLRARRGSNPFPGANLNCLQRLIYFSFFIQFAITAVLTGIFIKKLER